jgi:hypothetical protein
MDRRIMLWAAIGLLFVFALFLTFKAGAIESSVQTVQATGVAAKSAAVSAPSSGMVGGC